MIHRLAPPTLMSSRNNLSSWGVWGPACLWLCDLGQQPAPVTHFLHLYNETIGLDVLEGSFQHSESTVFPPLALTPPPHPWLSALSALPPNPAGGGVCVVSGGWR